jgi:hypothetical protein
MAAVNFPHADCAECIHWVEERCLRGHNPSNLGPYQKCWWCNTKTKDRKRFREAETGKLFGRG